MKHLRVSALAVLLLALGTLTACGSDDSGDSGSTTSAAAGPEGFQPGGANASQLAATQQCLEAAGLAEKMPGGGPSGGPSGTPPTGAPTGVPPNGAPGGEDGALDTFADPAVQAALEACGIELPSRPAAPSS